MRCTLKLPRVGRVRGLPEVRRHGGYGRARHYPIKGDDVPYDVLALTSRTPGHVPSCISKKPQLWVGAKYRWRVVPTPASAILVGDRGVHLSGEDTQPPSWVGEDGGRTSV